MSKPIVSEGDGCVRKIEKGTAMRRVKDPSRYDILIIWMFFGVFMAVYLDFPYMVIGILLAIAMAAGIVYIGIRKR